MTRLNQYGAPVRGRDEGEIAPSRARSYGGNLYPTPRNSGDGDFYRPRPALYGTSASALGPYDLDELRLYSQLLFAQVGELGSGILQKASYAVGDSWLPQYRGTNEVWGKAAEEYLHQQWCPNCDIRGGVFDFATQLFLSSIAYDVHGDDAVLFVEDENGLPKLKHVEAASIGNGTQGEEVKGGHFDGAKICNGVIKDRAGTQIGLRILTGARNGSGSSDEPAYIDVGSGQCQLLFEPEFRAMERGVPKVARAILDWASIQDINWYLKLQVKMDSAQGILAYNETGSAVTGPNFMADRPTGGAEAATATTDGVITDVKVEKILPGQYQYLRANAGEKLEPYSSARPHQNVEAFVTRIQRSGLAAVGWCFDLLDPSAIGGASVRAIQDQARNSVLHRQKTLLRRAKRCVQYAVAMAMRRGLIPQNRDGDDFMRWGFSRPAQLTVDAGYDEQADRENMLLGTLPMASVCQKRGRWWVEVRQQRYKENVNLIEHAVSLVGAAKEKGAVLTLREALDMMQRDNPQQRQEFEDLSGSKGQGTGQGTESGKAGK